MPAATAASAVSAAFRALSPPPTISLSDWCDANYYLSAESSADPGPWRTLPYQREIMDCFTDPSVEEIWVRKSARVGATKILNGAVAYFMKHDPCPQMVVQPTVEDAEGYSIEEISTMLRDCRSLHGLVSGKTKTTRATILSKSYPGGSLSIVGATSGRGFRRVSRRVVLFDEVDGYPASAGNEGDQITLGIRRTDFYANRKIAGVSTPLIAGASRIESRFLSGDQRRYHVPCPQCGHEDFLVFSQESGGSGHWMKWPKDRPEEAHFVCSQNGCVIEEDHKYEMLERGRWVAAAPFNGIASFHVWAAYSVAPNATWGKIAAEFLAAKAAGPLRLKVFVNTVLGEPWRDKGEAPSHELLFARREKYPIGSVPNGVAAITCGVDVQKDRIVYEVVGWCLDYQSFSVDAGILWGDTSEVGGAVWTALDELINGTYGGMRIRKLAIDAGYNAQIVYNWARRYPMTRVMAVRGVSGRRSMLSTPTPVDVTILGKRMARAYKVWSVGVDIVKEEFYGWLRLSQPADGSSYPQGYCHFPEYDPTFFAQITAEELMEVKSKRTGHVTREWHRLPGRENHWLDCRVYARIAVASLGLDWAKRRPGSGSAKAPARTPHRGRDSEPRRRGFGKRDMFRR